MRPGILPYGLLIMLVMLVLSVGPAGAKDVNAERGVIDFLAPVNADQIIQHAKEVYVLNGCAYSHGV